MSHGEALSASSRFCSTSFRFVKAGEKGEFGLLEVVKSEFLSPLTQSKSPSKSSRVSSHVGCTGLALPSASACALAACSHGSCSVPSSAVVPLCMHVDDTCACINSCSDTVSSQVPRGRRRVKGGASGPAEDLLPVSEVETGVNFRLGGGVRGQVAGSLPGRQPGTGTRQVRGGAVTPSRHPEVPDTRFASPGRGLGIRQSMGWTKVCSTATSETWVLKGNARACMLPENIDHLRVGWISRGSYETAWVTPGHDCLCPYQTQTNDAIWDGVIGL